MQKEKNFFLLSPMENTLSTKNTEPNRHCVHLAVILCYSFGILCKSCALIFYANFSSFFFYFIFWIWVHCFHIEIQDQTLDKMFLVNIFLRRFHSIVSFIFFCVF